MNLIQRLAAAWAALKGMAELHPELSDREHLARMRSDEAPMTSSAYSYLRAVQDYGSYVWVRKAVQIVAQNFASLPVQILTAGKDSPTHPLAVLLGRVNDTMSPADLWQQWAIDMYLGGEEPWELVRSNGGDYVEIWPRQPHTLYITPDAAGRRYYRVAYYKIDDGMGDPYPLPPDELIHFKFYNPANPWRGISPFTAVRSSIVIDQLSQAWSKLFLKNNARPDYAIITPQGVTPTEKKALLEKIRAAVGGGNAHDPIVLEEGIEDIKILSFPPKDLEWIEQRKLSRSEVAAIAGVPDEIMGYGRDTYENFGTALRVLWTLTIMPIATLRDTHMTEFFRRNGVLRDDEAVATDYSGVSVLKEDFGAKLTQAKQLFDMGVPFNRADKLIGLGVGAIPGGDIGFLPLGLAPTTTVALPPAPDEQLRLPPPKVKRVRKAGPEYGSDEHKALWEAFVKRVDPHERRLGDEVRGLLGDQEGDVKARLADDAEDAARNPFDRAKWRKTFRERTDPLIKRTVQDAGDDAAADLDFAFNVDDPNVVRFLTGREQRFARRVNDTTWQQLKASLGEGVKAGESIPELEKRVTDVMGLRKGQSKETIARTEVIGASNGGTLLSWKQSDQVSEKTWLATMDDRVRDSHADAHGQTVGLDDDFDVGNGSGPAPGQIGLAEEDVNCRCSMIAVMK